MKGARWKKQKDDCSTSDLWFLLNFDNEGLEDMKEKKKMDWLP